MNATKLDHAFSIAANVAYVLVVCSILVVMFPGLRKPLGRFAQRLVFDYRYGVWAGRQPLHSPAPAWTAALSRPSSELPGEAAP